MSELRIDEVTLDELPVLVVAKDGEPGKAAGAAFCELEAALPSLRGRRFYGYYEPSARRYFACVVAQDDDALDLDRRTLSIWTAAHFQAGPTPAVGCTGSRLISMRGSARRLTPSRSS
jgi:hypothetical protein